MIADTSISITLSSLKTLELPNSEALKSPSCGLLCLNYTKQKTCQEMHLIIKFNFDKSHEHALLSQTLNHLFVPLG